MRNTGISVDMYYAYGAGDMFTQPHNAYLQWILDNGLIGFIVVFIFYSYIVRYSYSLFKDTRDSQFIAIGGICLSLVGALLIASIGSQTFYPREGAVGMWCAMGLMLRVFVERAKMDSESVDSGTGRFMEESGANGRAPIRDSTC